MDDDLDNIQLDFEGEELQLPEEEYRELLHSNDVCDIECLGAPFLPKSQTNTCPCDNYLRWELNKKRENEKKGLSECKIEEENELNERIRDEPITSPSHAAKVKNKNASLHLDEFILELLTSKGYESYIHWTKKEKMEFKITKPQRIAALWGDRKCRKMMTYDKLLRGIRYCMKKGKFEKSDSQQLLFRFAKPG